MIKRSWIRMRMVARCVKWWLYVLPLATLWILQPASAAQTIVSLTFDDGINQSQVGDLLLSHGMKGTFYVNSNLIGQGGGYLSKAELDALVANGNEIGGHTINHVDLATLSDNQQRAAICNDYVTLNTWYPGQIHSFAYPFASSGPTTQTILAQGCGGVEAYTNARTVGGLVSGNQCTGCPTAETIPPGNPYYISTPESILSNTSLDQIKTLVTQAENGGGGWVPLVFHQVCSNCDLYSISETNLNAFLTWLQAREVNNTVVRTVNEVLTGEVPPPPPPPPLGANLLINPSLELDQDGNNQADCWERDAWGSSSATWTRTNDAYDGLFAERIQVNSYSNGDLKLLQSLDGGQAAGGCAPVMEAGTYQFGAMYKASTPVIPVLFYLDTNGNWQYWRDGPLLPISSTWNQMSFNIDGPPPNGAQAISFGIAIESVGSLTTDDYSMRKLLPNVSDTTPPTVSLTSPAAGTVSGTLNVTANASDNVGVAGVQFLLDGTNLGAEDSSPPYSVAWNTTTTSNGTHVLSAVARDAAGNSTTSVTVTVTVSNDTTPPTISITSPAAGTVSGTLNVTANASDNVGVVGVQFLLDGVNLGAEDSSPPYSVSWNTTSSSNATHVLSAVARDAAGNSTTSATVTVTVNNIDSIPPTVSLTSPAAGSVSGTLNVAATAGDNVGVVGVQFLLDGANLGAEDSSAPYSVSWNTTTSSNGTHVLSAVARDAAGNSTTSATVTVTVSNDTTPPTVSITSPAAGSVSGTLNVTASASDNVGVIGVQFLLDGVNLGTEDSSAPYTVSWNSATSSNGTHVLSAVARDAAGNSTASVAVTVTVNNVDGIPPTVSLTSPAAGSVSGTINVTASASDNVGVAGVQFLLDGANLGVEDSSAPYSVAWDSMTASNGIHTLSARARDAAGNVTTSSSVSVTVNNTTPSDNLINNPSLEIDANANGVPDCWLLGGYGSNSYIWSRVGDAHSGSYAESLQITSISSGDRKLVPTLDSGTCAPAVTPGQRYTLKAWYKSTTTTGFVVFYRTSGGSWRYWQTSPNVAAAGNWTQASYTTPVIPAGATHLSFGLYLSRTGTLITDDYAMTPLP